MPTPPATKTTFRIVRSSRLGGQTKEPPTLICSSFVKMFCSACQSQAAGGLDGDFCMASSRYDEGGSSRDGGDVMVKPPALETPGAKTSSHWPGKNFSHQPEILEIEQ